MTLDQLHERASIIGMHRAIQIPKARLALRDVVAFLAPDLTLADLDSVTDIVAESVNLTELENSDDRRESADCDLSNGTDCPDFVRDGSL
jgi:hypothetical protein